MSPAIAGGLISIEPIGHCLTDSSSITATPALAARPEIISGEIFIDRNICRWHLSFYQYAVNNPRNYWSNIIRAGALTAVTAF
ncbi:hypothetical protein D9K77_27500 [Klebsiella pneumoniae]|nr:hypothetical protein D9K77_27500 [Klebsiella pneumoniae]HBY5545434.1 hypothetical protein [Klebsiella pneumoniae]